ncbi:MAG TPA: UDP-glucose 4-epimerase GalE, partial [Ktedonobacterales bacterium]|nr:UDP-glucose 4-epimerase GalE [Ktedonobacterales bacterium]
ADAIQLQGKWICLMKVLVTGGAGYIGSVITEKLLGAGHEPIIYDSFLHGHAAAIPAGVAVVRGDVRDTTLLLQTLRAERIEAVIHMAGLIEAGLSVTHPEQFFAVNVGGSASVCEAVCAAGVRRLVFSSTGSIYGNTNKAPFSEDTPAAPENPYAESKLMAERMLASIAPARDMVCTALRYFNAAGATERNGEAHEPETHLIPLVLGAAERGAPVSIFGTDYPTPDGTTIRDYVHVVDLARAHLLALAREQAGLRIYNVGTGTGYSVRQVVTTAQEVTRIAFPICEEPRRPGDQIISVASAARITTELGWQPRYGDLRAILASAWAWRQQHPHGYDGGK